MKRKTQTEAEPHMEIGAAKIVLDYYGNNEARKKHNMIKDLFNQLRRHHKVSYAEVEDFDDPERGVIGITVVGTHPQKVRKQLQDVLDWIDDNAEARVVYEFINVFPFDENGSD
jgi:uncharacterized protein YlxP (DUF503 family)